MVGISERFSEFPKNSEFLCMHPTAGYLRVRAVWAVRSGGSCSREVGGEAWLGMGGHGDGGGQLGLGDMSKIMFNEKAHQ